VQNRISKNEKPCKQRTKVFLVLFFYILLVNFLYHAHAQSNDTIFKNYKKIETQKIDSILGFNQDKNQLKYYSILPNLSYDIKNSSFGIGVSLSNLSTYFQTKQRNKIELERLRFQLLDALDIRLEKLTNEYELVINSYELLKMELDNNKLNLEMYNLKKSQYDNNKITLEMWLLVQNDYQTKNLLLFARRKNLITKMKQFEVKIKSPCFTHELSDLQINRNNQ
jgi:hypothetical protein